MNLAIIVGHLGRDPEGKQLQNGTSVANLSVGTPDQWTDRHTGEKQEKTDWHRVVVWGKAADFATRYLRKGRLVEVQGKMETRKWTGQDGVERYTTEVKTFNIRALNKADNGSQPAYSEHAAQSQPPQQQSSYSSARSMSDVARNEASDEIPF